MPDKQPVTASDGANALCRASGLTRLDAIDAYQRLLEGGFVIVPADVAFPVEVDTDAS